MAFYKKYDIIKGREKLEEGGIKTTQTLLNSFKCAVRGALMCRKERNMQIHIVFAFLAIVLSLFLRINQYEWIFIIMRIGQVMSSEISNSALETLADGIHPEQNEKVGTAKDKAAGHVLVDAIISAIIGIIIFIPKIIALI